MSRAITLSDHAGTSALCGRADRCPRYLPLILALAPPLYLIAVVFTQTVDVPFADQWALAPLLERSYQGRLTLHDLWMQHNEHRLLFPRLIMLLLARLSGWNTRYELAANVVLAAGIFGVLVCQLRSTSARLRIPWSGLVPVLSLVVFSLSQAENWWGGWNIQIFLNALCASLCIVLLTGRSQAWPPFLLALACAVVASYSYSTGLLVWAVGLALLALRPDRSTSRARLRSLAWAAAAALTIATFFYHYAWTAQTPALAEVLGDPRRYLTYTLTYLGAPPARGAVEYLFGLLTGDQRAICNLGDSDLCAYVNAAAIAAGLVGALLFVVSIWLLARKLPAEIVLPYLGLGLYALITGGFTSLGRASYGNHQALAQRYATTASLFWAALVVMLWLCRHVYWGSWRLRGSSLGIIVVISLLIGLSTLQGMDHFRAQYEFLRPARDELFSLKDDQLLLRLYFDPEVVRRDARILQTYHLSVFR